MTRTGVLHLATFLQGGAGRAIADLACAQHAAGRAVTVVASETGEEGYGNYAEYLERLRDEGVTVHLCDSSFKRDASLNQCVLRLLQARVDPGSVAVVHAHAAVPARIGAAFVAGAARPVPVVQTQHGWGTSKTIEQAATDVAILQRVDRVVTTSAATRNLLAAFGVPADSIVVIPCGLAPDDPAPAPEAAHRRLEPLRARGARLVGCIGSVTANKNQRLLIDALALLPDLDLVAVFVGEGSEALLAHAETAGVAGRVLACGYEPRASRWLPLMDALVLPSRSEGQGLVVLEGFRAGVPVVASRIPALTDLLAGDRGCLFEKDNAGALAAALRTVLTMPDRERRRCVDAARRYFEAEFTLERMIERHDALYEELTGRAEARTTTYAQERANAGRASGAPGGP